MTQLDPSVTLAWNQFLTRILPFADVASVDLPLKRLLRLSLFQLSVGMALVLLNGTLNRVLVVEMHVPAWLVGLMVSLPLLVAPLRALVGHRSDYHHSAFGLRRVPYIWLGTLLQFGGFAIMPFALVLLADDANRLHILGEGFSALAFLLVGAGLHTTQTAGLALATDLAPEEARPRVVAMLYVMLLSGMVCCGLIFGKLLQDFDTGKLIALLQGVAVLTIAFNLIALWKQEAIDAKRAAAPEQRPSFRDTWADFISGGQSGRLLLAVGLGAAGFTMQDILLEPFGGEILHQTVSQTTWLTAILAGGNLIAFALVARLLGRGGDPQRVAIVGVLVGIVAFAAVIAADALDSAWVFRSGTLLIGFGNGLFSVGTLIAAMALAQREHRGLALGAWGAVQATAAGTAVGISGVMKDVITNFAGHHASFGLSVSPPSLGYGSVYSLEILLLIATLPVIVSLARGPATRLAVGETRIGLTQIP
ncbi:BCD family MFS transporter [uncultured Thiodictyon sp.]|uniref:BCD family MFS transporter n=1 Tax=uncultured Thiodictyon sp. TaxID=1846217 RepID=UPI0025EA016D|nr:BCD family MFS transporter [uncultured Thiodictyon sp.]